MIINIEAELLLRFSAFLTDMAAHPNRPITIVPTQDETGVVDSQEILAAVEAEASSQFDRDDATTMPNEARFWHEGMDLLVSIAKTPEGNPFVRIRTLATSVERPGDGKGG